MNLPSKSAHAPTPPFRILLTLACAGMCLVAGVPLQASPRPQNLGNGLDALVDSQRQLEADPSFSPHKIKRFNGFATQRAAYVGSTMIQDESGRVLVRVHPNGRVPIVDLQKAALAAVPSLKVQAVNTTYRKVGVFDAFVSLDDVVALSHVPGVSAVKLSPKPIHARRPQLHTDAVPNEVLAEIGTTFDFGVTQHRVDQINQTYNPSAPVDYEGRGISVGILSDSYDASTMTRIHAESDVAAGDLPGLGNAINSQPVVVLEDLPSGDGTDEGRAMLQTVFKMAPKARLAFASADYGEVDFSDNILALAGLLPGYYPDDVQQGFAADVVADDIIYSDEPFFQDGMIAQAVDIAASYGVSYFSSAGNEPGTSGYDSDFRFVANGVGMTSANNRALANTNIDLTNVPPALYAGGFHNFNPRGLDVAQTVNYFNAATETAYDGSSDPISTVLQWNDPTDVLPDITSTIYESTATLTYDGDTETTNTATFTVALTAGQDYEVLETPDSDPATPGLLPLDGIVTVTDPSGTVLSRTDNTSDGDAETVLFSAPVTGNYTISVTGFEAPDEDYVTDGAFTLDVYTTDGLGGVTQDLNLLVFDMDGNYLASSSATSNNFSTNAPIETATFLAPTGATQVQFVISRAVPQPLGGHTANHLRYVIMGDGITPLGPAEYFNYLTPVTFGHSAAAGASSVAAYAFFRPSIPEFYSSPGPSVFYFDGDGNRLSPPEVRLKPDLAAMDGANTTFFGGDDREDLDTDPNFFGTSDASPHAAAIAALVLEAHGGTGSVTPTQLRSVLQSTAFAHDLDPFYASGTARTSAGGRVTVAINSDDEDDDGGTAGNRDPNSISVSYTGPGSLATFALNPQGTAATAGNTSGGKNGLTPHGVYFSSPTPGMVFAPGTLTLGNGSPAFTNTSVTETTAYPITAPPNGATLGLYFTEKLAFTPGIFTNGKTLRFTLERYIYQFSNVVTPGGFSISNGSADLFGNAVRLPNSATDANGMSFSGTTSTGATFSGFIRNRLGKGYTVLDGFGFLNAEAAVSAPLP